MRQQAQIPKDPFFCVFPYRAGIQNHEIGFPRLLGESKAHGLQHPHNPLTVGNVLLTAKGLHTSQWMRLPGFIHLTDTLLKFPLPRKGFRGNQYIFRSKLFPPKIFFCIISKSAWNTARLFRISLLFCAETS